MATFDLSGLVLLESTRDAMVAAQAATPSLFTGHAQFTATFNAVIPIQPAVQMTRNGLSQRLREIELSLDKLPM